MILCLETATSLCSVSLCDRNGSAGLKESDEARSHAFQLTVFIEDILDKSGTMVDELEAVAVSGGPGSYTGLRIGVSTGKGIAYGASIPLLSVPTTLSMFYGFSESSREKYGMHAGDLFCPALDARRMEIYYAVYDINGNIVKDVRAEIIGSDSMNDLPLPTRLFMFGDGAAKCREVIRRKNTIFDSDFRISAAFMRIPAYDALDKKRFENVAYFEPFYLKDFITTKPVKNIIGKNLAR